MDRFRALEVFVAVAEAGSLAGAARSLSISPPSVTRIVGELESALGALLFHRTTRLVSLTEVGQAYLEDARRILSDFETANDAARGAHRAPTGALRVTAPTLFGQYYVSPVLTEYLDRYPEVRVEAVYLDRIVNLIEEGLDVAIRIGPLPDSSMMAVRVGSVRRVVCGCPSYFHRYGLPQTPDELAAHKIIAAGPVTPANDWRFGDGSSVRVEPRLSCTSVPAAIAAARTGWGLTRVLSYQIGPDLGSGGLQTILSDYEPEPLPIHIVHGEGRSSSAKVRAFVDMAAAQLRAVPYLS